MQRALAELSPGEHFLPEADVCPILLDRRINRLVADEIDRLYRKDYEKYSQQQDDFRIPTWEDQQFFKDRSTLIVHKARKTILTPLFGVAPHFYTRVFFQNRLVLQAIFDLLNKRDKPIKEETNEEKWEKIFKNDA